jgi:hypothetical protein
VGLEIEKDESGVLTRKMVFPIPQVAETKPPQSADVIGEALLYDETIVLISLAYQGQ